jgi:hypothetical protein
MYIRVVWGGATSAFWRWSVLLSSLCRLGGHCSLFAANVDSLFENVVHAARVYVEACRNSVLEFAVPMSKPDLDGVIETEFAARRIVVVHQIVSFGLNPLETETGKCDSKRATVSEIGKFQCIRPAELGFPLTPRVTICLGTSQSNLWPFLSLQVASVLVNGIRCISSHCFSLSTKDGASG